jgi:hypothetical protein
VPYTGKTCYFSFFIYLFSIQRREGERDYNKIKGEMSGNPKKSPEPTKK